MYIEKIDIEEPEFTPVKCPGCGEWGFLAVTQEGEEFCECLNCWQNEDGTIRIFGPEKQLELFQ